MKKIIYGIILFVFMFVGIDNISAYSTESECKNACSLAGGTCSSSSEKDPSGKCFASEGCTGKYSTFIKDSNNCGYPDDAGEFGYCYSGPTKGEYVCNTSNNELPDSEYDIFFQKVNGYTECLVGNQIEMDKDETCKVNIASNSKKIVVKTCKIKPGGIAYMTRNLYTISLKGSLGGNSTVTCTLIGKNKLFDVTIKSVVKTPASDGLEGQEACKNCDYANGDKCVVEGYSATEQYATNCGEGFAWTKLSQETWLFKNGNFTKQLASGTGICLEPTGSRFYCKNDNYSTSSATIPGGSLDPLNPWDVTTPQSCEELLGESAKDAIKLGIIAIRIITPLLLVLLSGREFLRAIISQDQDALVKAWKTFGTRAIITVAIMLLPTIVNLIGTLFDLYDSCGIW